MAKFRIAFDVNGNDNGSEAAVKAAVSFLEKNPDYEITLVGNQKEMQSFLNLQTKNVNLKMIDNQINASLQENIKVLLKSNSSMKQAIELVKNNEADAVLSSGDSGAYLALCAFILKRIPNVSRPAFMPIVPTIKAKKFLLLDVGANLDCRSEFLYEWALIGNEYAKVILDLQNPRVSLINIGTEEYKGKEEVKEAYKMLQENKKLNFTGYVESRDILQSITDVAVIEGYAGNILLKSLEGTILSFVKLIKQKIKAKMIRKIGYLFIKGAFKDISKTLDYRNTGSAYVIGVNGLAMKSHGSSDYKSYLGSLNQIKLALEKNIITKVKEAVSENK